MMAELLQNVCSKYKKSVSCNPDLVGRIESLFRVSSYIIAGKFKTARLVCRCVYDWFVADLSHWCKVCVYV